MMTIRERREVYMATHGDDEKDDADFEIPARKTTNSHDRLQYVLRAVWPQQVQRTIPGQHSFDHLS